MKTPRTNNKNTEPDRGRPLLSDREACYAAFKARDARLDGRVFVCVSSTGIYCRPVCRARTPAEKNCLFVGSAGAAEAAGYRPCRLCRPELAPGARTVGPAAGLAGKAALLMEDACLRGGSLATLAARLGVDESGLRHAFAAEFGISPAQHRRTRRLLLAKSLLADTALPLADIAAATGFGDVRRLGAAFRSAYRMPPSAMRGKRAGTKAGEGATVLLGYRPPYNWGQILAFLEHRAIAGVESVRNGAYRRTVTPAGDEPSRRGWIAVENVAAKNALAVTVAPALLPVLPRVLAGVRFLFDLDGDPEAVEERLAGMNALKPGLYDPGIRTPGCFSSFEMAVRAILGQQITVKAAHTLAARFAARFGEPIATPFAELSLLFPGPETVCRLPDPVEESLGPLGIIGARARSIRALAGAICAGEIDLSPLADPETQMERLSRLPGIGAWTAHYLALRALGWPDAFPHTDYGVKKALPEYSEKELLSLSDRWRPWRSYATVNLWHSLNAEPQRRKP